MDLHLDQLIESILLFVRLGEIDHVVILVLDNRRGMLAGELLGKGLVVLVVPRRSWRHL